MNAGKPCSKPSASSIECELVATAVGIKQSAVTVIATIAIPIEGPQVLSSSNVVTSIAAGSSTRVCQRLAPSLPAGPLKSTVDVSGSNIFMRSSTSSAARTVASCRESIHSGHTTEAITHEGSHMNSRAYA